MHRIVEQRKWVYFFNSPHTNNGEDDFFGFLDLESLQVLRNVSLHIILGIPKFQIQKFR